MRENEDDLFSINEDDLKRENRASSIQNGYMIMELMQEWLPKYSLMGTARLKWTKKRRKKTSIRVNMKRSNVGTKNISPNGLSIARAYRPSGTSTPINRG